MQSASPARVRKITVATSILLLLVAMMLPVCHIHPLLNQTAPDHCTICVSLHAAAPLGVHVAPVTVHLLPVGRVIVAYVQSETGLTPRFKESRGPPVSFC
jgi:hypothetical protein